MVNGKLTGQKGLFQKFYGKFGSQHHPFLIAYPDSKGLVIDSTSKYKKEAFELISWVFSSAQNDVLWIEKTKMPIAREDLTTNPLFEKYMDDKLFKAYCKFVPYAGLSAFIYKTMDIQQAVTTQLIVRLMYLKDKPVDNFDKAVKKINKLLF